MRTVWCVLIVLFIAGSARAVSTDEAIPIGGIKQWISIRATDLNNPVLLFLHGGPGNSAMGYANRFSAELQKHFVVVFWDQRETGKTLALNSSNTPLTVALMESDVVEMILYLKLRFSKPKIWLMGHSWGGFLGMTIARDHPELLEGFLAVSPMIDQVESERLSLEWLKSRANQDGNKKALEELETVKIPFENADDLFFHRYWLAVFTGNSPPSKAYVTRWSATWFSLFNDASRVNFMVSAPELKCPIYFFIGRRDFQTHYELAERYFNLLQADKKQLFWFEDSGHNLILTESKKFQKIILELH